MENIFLNKKALPAVSLVGRPNVGKSTLFNRLAKKKTSIVHAEPSVTRDRIYAQVIWQNRQMRLIDTGGLESEVSSELSKGILRQTTSAIEESQVIVMLTDATCGIRPKDREIALMLRKCQKPVLLVVNKCDSERLMADAAEFYELGLDNCLFISSTQGIGIEDLLTQIFAQLPKQEDENGEENKEEASVIPIAVVGKPNVGKSSFLNRLVGEERLLTSSKAGTTVDSVDLEFEYAGQKFCLIDTAGIRKKRSIYEDLEKMAVSSSLGALDQCSVALMLIDALEGVTEQDLKVASFIEKKAKGVIVVVNKWDLAREKGLKKDVYTQQIKDKMPFMSYAPICFVSALTGSRVFDVLETAKKIALEYQKRVTTGQVNRMLKIALASHQLPMSKGRRVKIFYGAQVSVAPPTFIFTCNDPEGIHFSYRRFLINQIRQTFGFTGVPVRMVFRARDKVKDDGKRNK